LEKVVEERVSMMLLLLAFFVDRALTPAYMNSKLALFQLALAMDHEREKFPLSRQMRRARKICSIEIFSLFTLHMILLLPLSPLPPSNRNKLFLFFRIAHFFFEGTIDDEQFFLLRAINAWIAYVARLTMINFKCSFLRLHGIAWCIVVMCRLIWE
jgi:hypothetical protein